MNWEDAARERDRALAARVPARQPATLGEILSSAWQASGLHTLSGSSQGRFAQEAYTDLVGALSAETGLSEEELRRSTGSAITPEAKAAALLPMLDNVPQDQAAALGPLFDIGARAEEKAAALERQAAETASATYGLGGHAAAWLAGVAREAIEPLNVAAGVAGGPFSGRLLPMLLRQFGAGGLAQALQEGPIQASRGELGLSHGAGEAAADILSAGVGNAGVAGLLRSASVVFRALGRLRRGEVPAAEPGGGDVNVLDTIIVEGSRPPRSINPLAEPPGGGRVSAEDFDAAARLAERNQLVAAEAPAATPPAQAAHAARVDAASAALDRSQPAAIVETTAAREAPPETLPDAFRPARAVLADGEPELLIRPRGERVAVRSAVVELGDLNVSHAPDGTPNPSYPAELQPRDRAAPASRAFIAERAAALEPELLGRSPTAASGAPVVGPGGVVESGNGRVLMIARAYDRHPDRAAAYRAFLEAEGFDLSGFRSPVLVRIRESAVADPAAFAREANVAPTAGMAPRERAAADARLITGELLSLWRGGGAADARNVPFVRAFARTIVPAEEVPAFISADNRLSAEGARRIEAALVARAYGAPDLVAALFEEADPSSRAILGALADAAPAAARLRAAVEEGRVPPAADVIGPLLEAYRIVDRARQTRQKPALLLDQVDLERGAVPEEVRAAARLYFRDDELRLAAGREAVALRIETALGRALDAQNGPDMFGFVLDAAQNLRAAMREGDLLEEIPLGPAAATGAVSREAMPSETWADQWKALKARQPFSTVDELYATAPARQAELVDALNRAAGEISGVKVHDPGIKARGEAEQKIARKDYNSPRELTDIVRAGAEVDSPEAAAALVARLRDQVAAVLDEGWVRTEVGYVDRKVMVVFEDGQIAEVQLWPREVYAAKARGSGLYARRRGVADPQQWAAMLAEEQAYWAAVEKSLPAAWSEALGRIGPGPKASSASPNMARASEASIGRPSQVTSAALTERQPLSGFSTQASAPSRTASRVSQSNSFMGDTSTTNIGAAPAARNAVVGDPELAAEAERVFAELGGDLDIVLVDDASGAVLHEGSARAALAAIEEDAAAARELLACIGSSAAPEAA